MNISRHESMFQGCPSISSLTDSKIYFCGYNCQSLPTLKTGTGDFCPIPSKEEIVFQHSLWKVLASTVPWILACCTTAQLQWFEGGGWSGWCLEAALRREKTVFSVVCTGWSSAWLCTSLEVTAGFTTWGSSSEDTACLEEQHRGIAPCPL